MVPRTDTLIGVALGERYLLEVLASEELLGRVYVARDLTSGKLVQVKVLHPHLVGNDEKFKRFGRELVATRMVQHPNTVAVLDSGTHAELHFIVFEYVAAHTLQQELDEGVLDPVRAAHIAAQVASAIGAAHQENIIHRNLSPGNILLLDNAASGAFVKVRDFGLSRLEKFDEEATNLTAAGARVGNIQYMPPEYIESNRVHPKGDLYALGTVLFQMLTGRAPYVGRAADVLGMHVTDPVPVPTEVMPGLPPWADEVVGQLMAKEPTDRPGAYQIVKTLEQGVGHDLDPPKLLGIDAEGNVIGPSRMPMVIAALGAAVLLMGVLSFGTVAVGAAGYWLWARFGDDLLAPAEPRPAPREGLEPTAPAPGAQAPAPTPVAPGPTTPAPAPTPGSRGGTAPAPAPAVDGPAEVESDPPARPETASAMIRVRANRRVLVYVDGRAVGYTPLDQPVMAGPHDVRVLVPGDASSAQDRALTVQRGSDETVEFLF